LKLPIGALKFGIAFAFSAKILRMKNRIFRNIWMGLLGLAFLIPDSALASSECRSSASHWEQSEIGPKARKLRREKRQRIRRVKRRHDLRKLRRSHRQKVRRGEIIFRP
jgi:hypothetical protein